MIIEVAVDSVESAIAAEEEGAQRIELCDNLNEGGTTPSFGMIRTAVTNTDIDVAVMIRPRGGDFLYSDAEFEVMKLDVIVAKEAGAHCVVFGLLDAQGNIDIMRTKALVDLARPMEVCFHRAFDMAAEPFKSLEILIELGIDRVLTSGQKKKALFGTKLIAEMVEHANGRIQIMPGSGVNAENVNKIVRETKVNDIHFTCHKMVDSEMEYINEKVSMGTDSQENQKRAFDRDKIREISANIESISK